MKQSPRIVTKLLLITTATLLAAASLFVYIAHRTGSQLLEQQVQSKARSISQFGSTLLEHFMLEGKHDDVDNLLRSGVIPHQVEELFILRNDGSVAFSSDSLNRVTPPLSRFEIRFPSTQARFLSRMENDTLYEYVVNPIVKRTACYRCHTNDEQLRGYFGVKISMADVASAAGQHRLTNILMSILAFLSIGIAIMMTIFLLVTRPLARLHNEILSASAQIRHLEKGKQLHLVPPKPSAAGDEIGDVINAFNVLLLKLDQAYESLRVAHQAQLQQADKLAAAGEMAAAIAHEIRNPLAGVLAALEVMNGDMAEGDQKKAIFEEMIAQLRNMNDSLNDLLAYTKPTVPVLGDIDINAIIEKNLSLALARAHTQSVAVHRDLAANLPTIHGDQKLLQQVLWNLVLNALHAMNYGGTLTIKTRQQNGSSLMPGREMIEIEIRDTGVGIPAAQFEKLFTPFHTTKHKGTGLGLVVSKQIVEQHFGSISVNSESGKGTSVTITLPVHKPQGIPNAS